MENKTDWALKSQKHIHLYLLLVDQQLPLICAKHQETIKCITTGHLNIWIQNQSFVLLPLFLQPFPEGCAEPLSWDSGKVATLHTRTPSYTEQNIQDILHRIIMLVHNHIQNRFCSGLFRSVLTCADSEAGRWTSQTRYSLLDKPIFLTPERLWSQNFQSRSLLWDAGE